MAAADPSQHIAALTPFAAVLAALDRLAQPVAARAIDIDRAAGRVLADDLLLAKNAPAAALALRDGWAVRSESIIDASAYAPVPVTAVWVEAGGAMPGDADAVLSPDAVSEAAGGLEALAAAAPGEGVVRAPHDTAAQPVRPAGALLRAVDIAAMRAAAMRRVSVREPLVNIVSTSRKVGAAADSVAPLIAAALDAAGARAAVRQGAHSPDALEEALQDSAADAVITIGGTGEGRADRTVTEVARHGAIALHGMGIRPGESAALAALGRRPVLMLPGRPDAALAVWLLVGERLIANMTAARDDARHVCVRLARKIVSTVGLAEVVLVRIGSEGAEPVAQRPAFAETLARADAWVLVPAASEGYPAGASVEIRPLP